MAPGVLRRGISVTLETKVGAVKGQIFIRHLSDRGLVAHEALELCSDVCGAVFVPVEEKEFAVSLCATPQAPYLFAHLVFQLRARTARPKTATACF